MQTTYSNFEWLTDEAKLALSRGYLEEGVSAEDRYWEICKALERYSGIKGFAERFFEYCKKGWISFPTPVLINFGHGNNLPASCNYSYIEDSLDDILIGLHEIGMLAKYGAGTAADFSRIRAMGEKISNGGSSNGVVPWIKLYEELINKVSQGSARRGFLSAYLKADHGDYMDFLDICTPAHEIQHITTGAVFPKGFMDKVVAGPGEERDRYAKTMRRRSEIGFPYIVFEDNLYKNIPKVYQDKAQNLSTSNICVTGDQRVVSDRGLKTAKDLYEEGGELTLFDGKKPVKSSKMKLIEKDADVYRITLKNGMTHDVTDYHKVRARFKDSRTSQNKTEMVRTKDLTTDHQVSFQYKKGLFGDIHRPEEAFIFGLYQADGTNEGNSSAVCIWENDFDLTEEIQNTVQNLWTSFDKKGLDWANQATTRPPEFRFNNTGDSVVKKKTISSFVLKYNKHEILDWVWEGTEETQWQFIRGLLYGDGAVGCYGKKSFGDPCMVSLASINKDFLRGVQLILANLGVKSQIHLLREGSKTLLPDHKGGKKEYDTKTCYRLLITNKNDLLKIEKNTEFLSRKSVEIKDRKYRDNSRKYSPVVSVEHIGKQDVYCVTVDSEEHVWTCNGVITSNCTEVVGDVAQDETFVCVLIALNAFLYDEWKLDPQFVADARIAGDLFVEEYIQKAEGRPGFEKAVNYAKRHRSVGMGVLGFHRYLQKERVPVGSIKSYQINEEIFSHMRLMCDKANRWMAEAWGESEYCKGYGLRGDLSMAQMPTKSTSFIMGSLSEGIEIEKSNYTEKKLAKVQSTFRNPLLEKTLNSYGEDRESIWESIAENNGSVQHLDFMSKIDKDIFKTAMEVSQGDVIQMAAQRQKYFDQSQSLNLFIHPDTPPKEVSKLVINAWKSGIKTLYYQYSLNSAQSYSKDLMSCSSCEL